ncbi:MAG: G1 family glutamic endopeptidase [Streptosporangiaceae bacterium]
MIRRWYIPLAIAGLALGSALATAGGAAASVHAPHPAAHTGVAKAGFQPGGLIKRVAGSGAAAARGKATAESTNWSGYAATGSNGSFTSVSASWKEPTGHCTSGTKYSSFWVGLDGYSSDSVEQTGTDVDCSGSTPQYYGWYEMYPAYPVNYSSTVKPGDSMSASVTFSGSDTYTLVLKDSTQGWTKTTVVNESGLARSSAEVITEAPSSSSGVLPLADFGTVSYSISDANGSSLASHSPTEIIMIDNSGRDKDSTSSIGSGGAFSNTWIRSN